MSDFMQGNVFARQIVAYHAKVAAQEKKTEIQKLRNRCWQLGALLGVACFTIVLLSGAIRAMTPLKELIPIILWRHETGVVEAAVTDDQLPIDMRDDTLKTWLWQYTFWREIYSGPMMEWAHHVVNAMSSVQVAAEYNTWSGAHSNPHSFQNDYGPPHAGELDRCTVFPMLNATSSDPNVTYTPPGPHGSTPGRYVFHFFREVQCRGMPHEHATEWVEAIDFVAGYKGQLDIRDVFQNNPSRIVVTGYAPPQPVKGALPGDITHSGEP